MEEDVVGAIMTSYLTKNPCVAQELCRHDSALTAFQEQMSFCYASEAGFKDSMFILAHLSEAYPQPVFRSGIVQIALDFLRLHADIGQLSVTPYTQQAVESACRLIWSLAKTAELCEHLHRQGATRALLRSLKLDLRALQLERTSSKLAMQVPTPSSAITPLALSAALV